MLNWDDIREALAAGKWLDAFGLDDEFSIQELKKSYAHRLKKFSPDRDAETFGLLRKGYETLTQRLERQEQDNTLNLKIESNSTLDASTFDTVNNDARDSDELLTAFLEVSKTIETENGLLAWLMSCPELEALTNKEQLDVTLQWICCEQDMPTSVILAAATFFNWHDEIRLAPRLAYKVRKSCYLNHVLRKRAHAGNKFYNYLGVREYFSQNSTLLARLAYTVSGDFEFYKSLLFQELTDFCLHPDDVFHKVPLQRERNLRANGVNLSKLGIATAFALIGTVFLTLAFLVIDLIRTAHIPFAATAIFFSLMLAWLIGIFCEMNGRAIWSERLDRARHQSLPRRLIMQGAIAVVIAVFADLVRFAAGYLGYGTPTIRTLCICGSYLALIIAGLLLVSIIPEKKNRAIAGSGLIVGFIFLHPVITSSTHFPLSNFFTFLVIIASVCVYLSSPPIAIHQAD